MRGSDRNLFGWLMAIVFYSIDKDHLMSAFLIWRLEQDAFNWCFFSVVIETSRIYHSDLKYWSENIPEFWLFYSASKFEDRCRTMKLAESTDYLLQKLFIHIVVVTVELRNGSNVLMFLYLIKAASCTVCSLMRHCCMSM